MIVPSQGVNVKLIYLKLYKMMPQQVHVYNSVLLCFCSKLRYPDTVSPIHTSNLYYVWKYLFYTIIFSKRLNVVVFTYYSWNIKYLHGVSLESGSDSIPSEDKDNVQKEMLHGAKSSIFLWPSFFSKGNFFYIRNTSTDSSHRYLHKSLINKRFTRCSAYYIIKLFQIILFIFADTHFVYFCIYKMMKHLSKNFLGTPIVFNTVSNGWNCGG